MLNDQEQEQLVKLLVATAEVLGHEMKPNAAMLMVEDLVPYSLPALQISLKKCRAELSGKLTQKAIIERLEGSKRVTANEAWAIALPAQDETNTVVWTAEIAQAWNIAQPIMQEGDKVGARMAFISAYERLMQADTVTTKWLVSEGWDTELRTRAVENAVSSGLLPAPQASKYLPAPVSLLGAPAVPSDRRQAMLSKIQAFTGQLLDRKSQAEKQRKEVWNEESERLQESLRQKYEEQQRQAADHGLDDQKSVRTDQ
ncbi:hypothetical protein [Serratia fonticola]